MDDGENEEPEDYFDSPYGSHDCDNISDNCLINKSLVQPLSDLAAQVTGEHYPCHSLENHDPPLDESMIKKVAFWAFPQSENRVKIYTKLTHYREDDWWDGETLIEENGVMEIAQVGFMMSAILSKPEFLTYGTSDSTTIATKSKMEDAKVSLSFERHRVTSATCSVCPQVIWCRHIVAVVIYRIRNAHKISVHAPVTEVLYTLNKNKIQKVLRYVVSEDPGGVTCRIFKHMDTIRDSRSELNQTQGAPDPTFGICSDQKSIIDLSLAQLNHDFREDLQRVRLSSFRYPDTCNFDEKAKSEIYCCYIQKVADLIGSDEVDSAGKVLISMANSTLNEISTQRHSMCVNRLFHDLERLFTCFIASFKGQIREDLVQTAIDINGITRIMDDSKVFIPASEWADLDSMPLEDYMSATCMSCHGNNSEGILGASRQKPFYQALCASLIPDAPDSLDDLLCGKQKPLTTSYEEKLPVMLLRFETVMHFGTKKQDKKLYNLGVVILRKLLNLSRKYSVIGCNKVQESSSDASSSESDESENEPVSSGTSTKRIRKQKTRPRKKPCSVPLQETTEVVMEGMSKAQLSYGLLFVCYTLYQIEDLVSLGLEGIPVILDATFCAMELGRFRDVAAQDAISASDYSWLVFLDKNIQESYLKLAEKHSAIHTLQEQAIQKYISALQEHQASFYGDNYAVGLLSLFLKDSRLSDKAAQMLSLEGASVSTFPLKNLTIPNHRFDGENEEPEDYFYSPYGSDFDDISDRSSQDVNQSYSNSPVPPDNCLINKLLVQPLSDLAARVTGEHYPCHFLVNHDPPLDESMIKKVAFWAFPQSENRVKIYTKLTHYKEDDWRDGETLIEENEVMEIAQVGFMMSAILSKPVILTSGTSDSTTIATKSKMDDAKVSLSFEMHRVTSATCSVCPQVIWCRHIVAVVIYRIRNAHKVPVHAPVTEVLYTLNRNQIQKVLQYAISEDPGGVTCRIFKHMDAIRNSRSELNQTQGAPDPTFGICSDQKSIIDLSLAQLIHDFREVLQRVRRSSTRYPDTCNFEEKAKSEIYRCYVQKVAELIKSDEVDSAGKVLISMANSTLNEMSTQRHSMSVNRLFHDLERLFTCFIASLKGQIREDLVQTAIDINGITRNMDDSEVFISEWADLDSMPLENYMSATCMSCHGNNSEGILGASRQKPFYQALCASLIPDAPDSLDDLLCGKQKPLTTSYEEKLPVMLLRFETVMHFGTKKQDKKLHNLGVVILRKLLNLSRKYSVIGCNKVQESTSEASSSESDESENEPVSSGTSTKRIRKQKSRPRKKPCSVPRLETTEVDMEGMSKAQLSYGLLFVCYTLYQIEDLVSLGLEGIPVILDATFCAMELGRFRDVAAQDAISASDYSWLVFLDKNIQESYLKLAEKHSAIHTLQEQAIQKYISALQEHQTSFYGDNYAVGLLSLFLKDSRLSDKAAQMLSLEGASVGTCPLKNLTIPNHRFDSSNTEHVKNKWTMVIKRIFSNCSDDIVANNTVLSKFLTFSESIDDIDYALLVYEVLKDYQKKLTLLEQRISCMKFLVRLVVLCNNSDFTGSKVMLCTSFVEVGLQIQMEFLGLILPCWQALRLFFSTEQLTKIIKVMEDSMKNNAILPWETAEMILKYFEAPYKHDEECSEFLKFFQVGGLRHEALQKVIFNNKNYMPTALLLLAKMEHDVMDSSTLPCGDLFSEDVFLLIQQAFKRLRELNENSDEDFETQFSVDLRLHLLWFFEKISYCDRYGNYGNNIVAGSQFSTVMDDIATTIRNDCQLLFSFFNEMKKSEPLFKHAKQVLGEHLVAMNTCYRK